MKKKVIIGAGVVVLLIGLAFGAKSLANKDDEECQYCAPFYKEIMEQESND